MPGRGARPGRRPPRGPASGVMVSSASPALVRRERDGDLHAPATAGGGMWKWRSADPGHPGRTRAPPPGPRSRGTKGSSINDDGRQLRVLSRHEAGEGTRGRPRPPLVVATDRTLRAVPVFPATVYPAMAALVPVPLATTLVKHPGQLLGLGLVRHHRDGLALRRPGARCPGRRRWPSPAWARSASPPSLATAL